ncbi:MAG: hypothetical protein JWQ00_2791 [Noviherbaspirillum sp.]|nr:hypothetical protein [Noviherbaspirillum sp.]
MCFNFPARSSAQPFSCEWKSSAAKMVRMAGVVAVLSASFSVSAQSRFDEDFDDLEKPWQEIAVQLPGAPMPENLLGFYVSPMATQSFAIDAKSLTVGSDGVVRYILVATSREGATNISYEGIRCESFEKKLYAFGRPDGSWSRSRRDQWERIFENSANRHHAALAKDYFCRGKVVDGKADDIVQRIRSQRPFTP